MAVQGSIKQIFSTDRNSEEGQNIVSYKSLFKENYGRPGTINCIYMFLSVGRDTNTKQSWQGKF